MSKIDRTKKYEGLGFTWSLFRSNDMPWKGTNDDGVHVDASHNAMQIWLDAGHIRPVKEKKIVRVEGVQFAVLASGEIRSTTHLHIGHPDLYGLQAKPVTLEFEVEA